jgi:hypothetical protein
MRSRTLTCRGLAALALLAAAAPAAAAPSEGWIHTDGTLMRDVDGRQVLLTGAEGVGDVTPQLTAQMNRAGLNVVRYRLDWDRLEPTRPTLNADGSLTHHWDAGQLAALDQRVRLLTAAHVRVILELHQSRWSTAVNPLVRAIGMPPWLYPGAEQVTSDQMKARVRFFQNTNWPGFQLGSWRPQELAGEFLTFLAKRYRTNSYVVGFDLLNEPTWGQHPPGPGFTLPKAADLVAYYRKTALALRAINPNLLMVWEPGTFTQVMYQNGTTVKATDQPLDVPNSVVSIHFYPKPPARSQHIAAIDRVRRMAVAWNQPFWIGEFNAYEHGRDQDEARQVFGDKWKALTLAMMSWTKSHDVGWSFWALQRGAGAALVDLDTGQLKPDIIDVLRTGMLP